MYLVAPLMLGKLINGTVIFPLLYAHLLYRILPGFPLVKGMSWGLILWFLSQALITPMMGSGMFSVSAEGRDHRMT